MQKATAPQSSKDIIHLIIYDHDMLRDSIKCLKDEQAYHSEKKRQLARFLFNLKIHASSEEKSLYDALVGLSEIRPKILEGFEEHNIADHLVSELSAVDFQTAWSDEVDAKAKVLAELVEHHIDEEEEDLFPQVKNYMTKQELLNLGVIYQQQRKELRNDLENRFTLASLEAVSWTVQKGLKDISSFVSNKISNR